MAAASAFAKLQKLEAAATDARERASAAWTRARQERFTVATDATAELRS